MPQVLADKSISPKKRREEITYSVCCAHGVGSACSGVYGGVGDACLRQGLVPLSK